jgi:hypothetical protein
MLLVLLVSAALPGLLRAQVRESLPELEAFLRQRLKFVSSDLVDLKRGKVVTRVPGPSDDWETSAFGIVRIRAPIDSVAAGLAGVAALLRTPLVTRIGSFGRPPRPGDVDSLILTREHLDAFRNCRQGDCDVKLPADLMERLERTVDWSQPAAREQVQQLFREWLVEYVRLYFAGGTAALTRYADKLEPQEAAEGARRLLGESPYLLEYVPAFHHYLEAFPNGVLADVSDYVYWSVEDFGLRPLISASHVTVHRRSGTTGPQVIVAIRRIYASHYLQADLTILSLVEDPQSRDEPAFFLLLLGRSLLDTKLGGIKGGLLRGRVLRNNRDRLESIRLGLEDTYRGFRLSRDDS